MSLTATPQALLEALRLTFVPVPILPRIPTALQIFAHLQLLSARIGSEAKRALVEQRRITHEFVDEGMPVEEWTESGALGGADARILKKWAKSEGEADKLLAFSLRMRKEHLIRLMSTPKVTPDNISAMLDVYFPGPPGEDDFEVDEGFKPHLFIRMMPEDKRELLYAYRREMRQLCQDFEKSYAAGRSFSVPSTLPSTAEKAPLELLADKIMREAEGIVRHAEEFEAMLSSNVAEVPHPVGAVKAEAQDEHSESAVGMLFQQADAFAQRKPSEEQSAPATASSTTAPRISTTADNSTLSKPFKRESLPARQSNGDGHSAPAKKDVRSSSHPSKKRISPLPKRERSASPHRVSKPLQSPAEYARLVVQSSKTTPKVQPNPLDQRALKRPRPSEDGPTTATVGKGDRETGGGIVKRSKTQDLKRSMDFAGDGDDAGTRRKVLGNKAGLENSQSSGESQETKEKRRAAKGKGRLEGETSERRAHRHPVD